MQQLKAFKYRIYPTQQQQAQLDKFFGAKRWVYNQFNTNIYKYQL